MSKLTLFTVDWRLYFRSSLGGRFLRSKEIFISNFKGKELKLFKYEQQFVEYFSLKLLRTSARSRRGFSRDLMASSVSEITRLDSKASWLKRNSQSRWKRRKKHPKFITNESSKNHTNLL